MVDFVAGAQAERDDRAAARLNEKAWRRERETRFNENEEISLSLPPCFYERENFFFYLDFLFWFSLWPKQKNAGDTVIGTV